MLEQNRETVIKKALIVLLVSVFAVVATACDLGIQKNKKTIPLPDSYIGDNDNQPVEEAEGEEITQRETEDVLQQVDVDDKGKNQNTPDSENNLSANEPGNNDNIDSKTGKNSDSEERTSSELSESSQNNKQGTSSANTQTKTVKDSQGKQKIIYEITVETVTKDGKTQTKTYTSTNPNETIKFYDYVKEDGKIRTYEVTMTVTGREVSRKLISEESAVTVIETQLPSGTNSTYEKETKEEMIYTLPLTDVYTRDGKCYSTVYESTNPDEVITYYVIENGRFYEIKQNMRGDILSKKEIKVDYTYKEVIEKETLDKYSIIRERDATLPVGQEVVVQEGIDGIIQIVRVEKYLFDQLVGVDCKIVVKRERQDMIIKEGTRNPMGNSGKLFDSVEEAKAWAEQERNNPDSPWYKHNYMIYPIDHTETKYTVDFFK